MKLGRLVFFRTWLVAVLAVVWWAPAASAESLSTSSFARAPDFDRLFQNRHGWIGGDGCFSVPLEGGPLLWLYGDSFIGRIEGGRRGKPAMINNVVALQKRSDKGWERPAFFWKTGTSGPEAFFRPPDHRGWFWPLHGIETAEGLFVFLLQIERTGDVQVFGFRNIGLWLARIANPRASPDRWAVGYRKVPWCSFGERVNVFWGSALLAHEGLIYVYGIEEFPAQPGCPKRLLLARTAAPRLDRFAAWEFAGGPVTSGVMGRHPAHGTALEHLPLTWSADFRKAVSLHPDMATEFSVHAAPTENGTCWLLTYSEPGLSRRILQSRAPHPTGPWSVPRVIFTVPDESANTTVFTYAGKAHPALFPASGGQVVTYVLNSFRFEDTLEQARLYWPRFLQCRP